MSITNTIRKSFETLVDHPVPTAIITVAGLGLAALGLVTTQESNVVLGAGEFIAGETLLGLGTIALAKRPIEATRQQG